MRRYAGTEATTRRALSTTRQVGQMAWPSPKTRCSSFAASVSRRFACIPVRGALHRVDSRYCKDCCGAGSTLAQDQFNSG